MARRVPCGVGVTSEGGEERMSIRMMSICLAGLGASDRTSATFDTHQSFFDDIHDGASFE
jgi:hypothetical protein